MRGKSNGQTHYPPFLAEAVFLSSTSLFFFPAWKLDACGEPEVYIITSLRGCRCSQEWCGVATNRAFQLEEKNDHRKEANAVNWKLGEIVTESNVTHRNKQS